MSEHTMSYLHNEWYSLIKINNLFAKYLDGHQEDYVKYIKTSSKEHK